MKRVLLLFCLSLSLGLGSAHAQEPAQRPKVNDGNVPRGEVIIRSDHGMTFQEYSNGTEIYKVKVIPKYGRPYFLVDSDGNGSLDMVQWILYSW